MFALLDSLKTYIPSCFLHLRWTHSIPSSLVCHFLLVSHLVYMQHGIQRLKKNVNFQSSFLCFFPFFFIPHPIQQLQ
jgi:hypothetical protein